MFKENTYNRTNRYYDLNKRFEISNKIKKALL